MVVGEKHSNQLLGIVCILIGISSMTMMDAVIKWLSGAYPLHEIVLVRTVISLGLTLVMVHFEGGLGLLNTSRPGLHIVRGLMVTVANMSFYLSLSLMPIAEATGLFFVAPLIITGLSGPLLGEKVGLRRWLAVVVGFIGVVLISGIGTDSFRAPALLSLLAAFAYALTQISTRKLGITDKASVMAFYIGIVFIVISSGFWWFAGDGHLVEAGGPKLEFLLRAWTMPDQTGWLLMVVSGVLVAVVGYMLSQAYRIAKANVIAPYEFVALPLAVLWGVLFWGEYPSIQTVLGIVLIAGAGTFVFIRERRIAAQMGENVSTV